MVLLLYNGVMPLAEPRAEPQADPPWVSKFYVFLEDSFGWSGISIKFLLIDGVRSPVGILFGSFMAIIGVLNAWLGLEGDYDS